ncbi:hypothetical protein IKS86_07855 [bacterium]|nr:hypothetical protein [bacterium]
MKSSNFAKKILFIPLFSALALFVACGSSDKEEDTTDSGVVSDEDSTDDAEPSGDTDSEPTEETDTATDDNSTDDSDEPAGDTDSDTEPEPTDEPDPEFEQNSEGCTMIEVPKITMGGAYADEINGYLSPAMGGNAIDIIRIYLLGDIKEGTYELGTGLNETYMNCEQCVSVWIDAELGVADEYYFQTHGTMTITEVKDVEGINRTVGRIRNLILKQAETDEYMSDFTLIPDGKCIAAEIVEWDTTNTPNNSGD